MEASVEADHLGDVSLDRRRIVGDPGPDGFVRNCWNDVGVSENRGKTPKMDGENKGKPYEQMDEFGGTPVFGNTHVIWMETPSDK